MDEFETWPPVEDVWQQINQWIAEGLTDDEIQGRLRERLKDQAAAVILEFQGMRGGGQKVGSNSGG